MTTDKMITRYLTIHFAPQTACITLEIPESKFAELSDAMGRHDGIVTLDVSSHQKISTKVNR